MKSLLVDDHIAFYPKILVNKWEKIFYFSGLFSKTDLRWALKKSVSFYPINLIIHVIRL